MVVEAIPVVATAVLTFVAYAAAGAAAALVLRQILGARRSRAAVAWVAVSVYAALTIAAVALGDEGAGHIGAIFGAFAAYDIARPRPPVDSKTQRAMDLRRRRARPPALCS